MLRNITRIASNIVPISAITSDNRHFTARSGRGGAQLHLSGYALSDESDRLDLFVSLYAGVMNIERVADAETKKAAEQCLRFLTRCVEQKLSSEMDESSDAYDLVQTIEQTYQELDQIRIYVLTDRKAKSRQFKPRLMNGKTIQLEVMDIERLFNHTQEGKPRDELVVNFDEVTGGTLPCVWVPNPEGEYDYAMTAIPGEVLRFLYERYGDRILEANVRSFLSQLGKVNKGIRDTLRTQPERFMAYNNGIVIVADEIQIGKSVDGSPGITWLKGMQIVNGGQTTASLFFTKKKFPDTRLRGIRVPAKIIVLRETNAESEEALTSDISRYANSQNVVRQSDLAANAPFHVILEKLAKNTYCPDGIGRWFYERSTGSYKVMLEREGKTPAGIRQLKLKIPTSRKIIKTDLAKYQCAWMQRPDVVSLGGQKCFAEFMRLRSGSEDNPTPLPDVAEYKNIIAQAILFRTAQSIIRKNYPAFQANITAYTVVSAYRLMGEKLDLNMIWQNQCLSESLTAYLLQLSKPVHKELHGTSGGRMISEWAKKADCWDRLSRSTNINFINKVDELL